jgi:hypothetical protein
MSRENVDYESTLKKGGSVDVVVIKVKSGIAFVEYRWQSGRI